MAGDAVGPGAADNELARVRAALGVQHVAKKAPVKKAAAKKAAPRKQAAKKAPAKKAPAKKARPNRVKKAAAKKAAAADPQIPDEVAGDVAVAEPAEVVAVLHELEDPARDAHDLWLTGMAWEEIALRTGYPGARAASAAVAVWLQRGAIADGVQAAQARAQVALETTQRVKSAFWERAMTGDKDAAAVVLAANRDFYKMAGLESGALTVNSKRTLIISDSGEGMAAQLREAALEAQARHAEPAAELPAGEDPIG